MELNIALHKISDFSFEKSNRTSQTIKPSDASTKTVSEPKELEALFAHYEKRKSRSYNIFQAIKRGDFPTAYPITLKNIPFEVPEGETWVLPDNVRLEDCTITQGTLLFSVDKSTATSPFVVNSPDEFKSVLGLYYTKKTVIENILQAYRVGNFPATDVIIKDINFILPIDSVVTLSDNIQLDNCTLSQGTLLFSKGKLTATKSGATAYANGPDAEAHTITRGGSAYANNAGSAYASFGGKSFALNDFTHAYAEGKDSKAYGLTVGSTVHATKGATACKNVDGVNVELDVQSHPGVTALHSETPPYYGQNSIHYSKYRYELFLDHLSELNDLANAGDAGSAFKLGMMPDDQLRDVFADKNPRVFFLERAHQLEHKSAAVQLGEYYMQLNFIPKTEILQKALTWYTKARDEMGNKEVQEKISQIEAKLKPSWWVTS